MPGRFFRAFVESGQLPGMPKPGRVFFAMPRIENRLGRLASNPPDQVKSIKAELMWLLAAQSNQTDNLLRKEDGRQQQ